MPISKKTFNIISYQLFYFYHTIYYVFWILLFHPIISMLNNI